MASALSGLILPEGTELLYVGVLLKMPERAEGAAVLVWYHSVTPAWVLCRQTCVRCLLWEPPQGWRACLSTWAPRQEVWVSLCFSKPSEAMQDCDGRVWLRIEPGGVMVPGVWETGSVLKMSLTVFFKWKMQGWSTHFLLSLLYLCILQKFFLVLHLKHFPISSCCYVTLQWVNSVRPGNAEGKWDAAVVTALIFPFDAVAVGKLRLLLWLCSSVEHAYIKVSILPAFRFSLPARLPLWNSLFSVLASSRTPSAGMAGSVMQHIWWGSQGTLEPERGLDLLFSYVMSEWCLLVHFQKTQIKDYEKRRVKKVSLHKLIVTSKLPWWKKCYMMQCQ